MILELAEWSVDNALLYRWSFSWTEILKFYQRKQKIYADRKQVDFDFLCKLAQAALGGKSEEGTVELDSGDGLDEVSEDQEAALRAALGDDYDKIYS